MEQIFVNLEDFEIKEVHLYENHAAITRTKQIPFSNVEKQTLVLRHSVNIDFSMGIDIKSNDQCFSFAQKDPAQKKPGTEKWLKISEDSFKTVSNEADPNNSHDSKEVLQSSNGSESAIEVSEPESIPSTSNEENVEGKSFEFIVTREENEQSHETGVEVEIKYFTKDAGWEPRYTYSFSTREKLVEVRFWAKILQKTGEKWIKPEINFMIQDPEKLPNEFEVFKKEKKLVLESSSTFFMKEWKRLKLNVEYCSFCRAKTSKMEFYAIIYGAEVFPAGKGTISLDYNAIRTEMFPKWTSSHQVFLQNVADTRTSKNLPDSIIAQRIAEKGLVTVNYTISYDTDCDYFNWIVYECCPPTTKENILKECLSPETTNSSILPYFDRLMKNPQVSYSYQGAVYKMKKHNRRQENYAGFTWLLTSLE